MYADSSVRTLFLMPSGLTNTSFPCTGLEITLVASFRKPRPPTANLTALGKGMMLFCFFYSPFFFSFHFLTYLWALFSLPQPFILAENKEQGPDSFMLVLVSVTAAVVLALSAGSADAQTAPWTADDLTKATSLGDASKCYYGLWTGKPCAYGSSGGVYLIDQNWYARAIVCVYTCHLGDDFGLRRALYLEHEINIMIFNIFPLLIYILLLRYHHQ